MKAERAGDTWVIKDGEDVITAWLDESGLRVHRRRLRSDKKGNIEHESTLSWSELVPKAEGQIEMRF